MKTPKSKSFGVFIIINHQWPHFWAKKQKYLRVLLAKFFRLFWPFFIKRLAQTKKFRAMREKCSHTVTRKCLNLDYFINCIKIERKHNELAEDQCFICQNVYISEKMAKIEVYSTQKVLLGVVYCRNSRNTKSIKGTNHRVLGWLGPFLPILPFSQKYTLFLPRCPPKVSPRSSLPPNFAFFPKVHAFSA